MGLAGSSFPNGFTNGILIRGLPLHIVNPGEVFYVNNSSTLAKGGIAGSNNNDGSYRKPFSTWLYAISRCVAGRGDIIVLMPNHAETISAAAGVILSKAGVATIGLGIGAARATITFSAATSTVTVTANNCTVFNILHLGGAATTFVATAYANANAVVANDFTIDSCEFRDVDATHGFVSCYTGGTTANQSDGLAFTNNKVFRYLTSPPAANTAVVTAAAIDRLNFSDNIIYNKAANNNIALGFALGANAVQNLICKGNRTQSLNTGTTAGELFSGGSTTSDGLVYDNYSWHLAATGLLGPVSTKLGFAQNFCSITGAADKSPLINPVAV